MPEPNGGDNGPDEESGAEARQAEAPKPRHQALTSALAVMAALAALASCLLNGSSALALAVPVIFCGAGLFLFPPRGRVHGVVLLCVLLGLAFAALSLLPATLAGRPPAWRTNLVENWGFILPATISAQPFLTQGALITVSVACCWFFWLAGMRLPAGSRRHALRTVALGIMTIAALSLAEHFGWIKLGWPLGGERPPVHMGPFINRNYLSSICAVGCVLFAALAHDAHLNRSLSWLGYAVAVLVPFAAIVINTSRGGLLLFCLGIVLWVATSGMRKGFFRKLAVNASLIFCGAAVLMVFGGGAGAKLMEQGIDRELSSEGARVSIYEQTLSLAAGSPLAGIGLGNFDSVFSLHHTLPALTDRITHPESDWLWWMSEAGIPALVCALVAGLWLVQAGIGRRRSRDASHSTRLDQRLRNAAGIAFALALIHGLFDTPLHNAGYALLVLLLGACAVSPRRQRTDSGLATRLAFRLLGLAVLAVGVAHASTALGRPVLPGRPAMRHQRQVIDDLMSLEKPQEALARLNQLILLAPLQWDLYYRRGLLRLALNHGSSGALADFGRARVLEPNNATICLEEGNLWLRHDPALAIIPWREFVRRRNDSWSYSYVLGLSRDYPALVQRLLPSACAAHGPVAGGAGRPARARSAP